MNTTWLTADIVSLHGSTNAIKNDYTKAANTFL